MKQLVFFAAITAIAMSVVQTAAFAVPTADATAPVDVRVRDTRQGPKLFVDGKAVRPAVSLRFRKGETRIFRVPDVTAAKPRVVRSERSCPPDVQKQ